MTEPRYAIDDRVRMANDTDDMQGIGTISSVWGDPDGSARYNVRWERGPAVSTHGARHADLVPVEMAVDGYPAPRFWCGDRVTLVAARLGGGEVWAVRRINGGTYYNVKWDDVGLTAGSYAEEMLRPEPGQVDDSAPGDPEVVHPHEIPTDADEEALLARLARSLLRSSLNRGVVVESCDRATLVQIAEVLDDEVLDHATARSGAFAIAQAALDDCGHTGPRPQIEFPPGGIEQLQGTYAATFAALYAVRDRLLAGWRPATFAANPIGLPTGKCWYRPIPGRGYPADEEREPMTLAEIEVMSRG